MTKEQEWKMAKWIKRHGRSRASDVPKKFCYDGKSTPFFAIEITKDQYGHPTISPDRVVTMSDGNVDAFNEERQRRIRKFRDWIIPSTSVLSIMISIVALVLSILSFLQQKS